MSCRGLEPGRAWAFEERLWMILQKFFADFDNETRRISEEGVLRVGEESLTFEGEALPTASFFSQDRFQ